MQRIKSVNPATNKVIAHYELHTPELVGLKVDAANSAFQSWSREPLKLRTDLMMNASNVLEANKTRYAQIITSEMGKVLKEALSEIEKCAWVCRYYAEHAEAFLKDESIKTDAGKSYVSFRPLGVLLAVMPWNFPFWQVFRFAAPALVAGNVGLLKHASNVPGCGEAIEEVFRLAGFPGHVFTNLFLSSDRVVEVISNPIVKAITLTGSEMAGSSVASLSGKYLKKTVLELGGSDAYLVLADADLQEAVKVCIASRLLNAGQSCIGAKRFIVDQKVYREFLDLFEEGMKLAKMGDPLLPETNYGPMARYDLRDELHDQVKASIDQGANLVTGGYIPDVTGAFYPATILSDVRPGMPAFEEELFGPVAAIIKAEDEQDCIRLANQSRFGLGAAVFTSDLERGERIARDELEAGSCFVNGMVKSDPRLPFGGIKVSGYGRELSYYGMKEFVNIKTVWVK